ncbi:shikimate kinase [Lachnospiraceae bacterium PM6-15]
MSPDKETGHAEHVPYNEGRFMSNIILIGMPASGKSTIGVVVAKRLGYQFIDTDLLIQEQEGKLLREIIDEQGIEGFLAIEDQVNTDVQAERTVISPGGSVVYCEGAMNHYKEIGTVVYLQVPFVTIDERINSATGRGVVLKEDQSLKDLYEERVPLFEKYADVTIAAEGLSIDEIVTKVLRKFKK